MSAINVGGRPKGATLERRDIYASEFQTLLDYLQEAKMRDRAKSNAMKAFHLLFYFGFRVSEIVDLKNHHIKKMEREKLISLGNDTKTKTPRDAYIADAHIEILKDIFQESLLDEDDFTLISPTFHPKDYYSKGSLTRMLNRVIHKALGDQYSTHSFRAGYITSLHRADVSIKVIQEIIGHTKSTTTMRYITVSDEEKRDAVEKIGQAS